MKFSAKTEYALRAAIELAGNGPGRVSADALAAAQHIPARFVEVILPQLRRAGIVASTRGSAGGYVLARPAEEISLADVIRAIDGPLADVHGTPPEAVEYPGAAAALRDVWIALRASERSILEGVSVADVARGTLPAAVRERMGDPGAWQRR